MDVLSIKVDFKKALKRIAKIRFYDLEVIKVPVKAEICKRTKCNAGLECCHLFRIMSINFCVW